MSQLSIVVPLLGAIPHFEDTLASVLRYRPANSQIIVPHNGSYADPYDLRGDVDFLPCPSARLIDFWNAALASAAGQFVCLFRPGISLDESWEDNVLDAMQNPRVASICPTIQFSKSQLFGIQIDTAGTRHLVTGKRAGSTIGPSSYAAVYRNDALGWLPQLDSNFDDCYLDGDIGLGLRELGFEVVTTDWILQADEVAIHLENQPHGRSAVRAKTRHASFFKTTSSGIPQDILAAITGQTWRFSHAWQKSFGRSAERILDRRAQTQLLRNQLIIKDLRLKQENAATRYRRAA